jgi:hypothetical protein
MFEDASSFNGPIGDWDVSKGEKFVSKDQSVALFPTWIQSQSITDD